MNALQHRLDRTILIEAPRDVVFDFFLDKERWASWWGPGSTIDARPGGRAFIRYPEGTEVSGEVLEVSAPQRFVFTYGYVSGNPIAPGASRVTITLEAVDRGTRVRLVHEFKEAEVRDEHLAGWRYQLSLFANVVADRLHADAADKVDRWFQAWAEGEPTQRTGLLAAIADPGVTFRDRFSNVAGIEDLSAHIGAAQRFMPGVSLKRAGAPRHCQGTVLADWHAIAADGATKGSGTSAFVLDASNRIVSATGFWNS